ncbi:MAG: hypothetical protein EAZ89_15160 [Bacteroidetes bacterium]|nr:MAG: hypothetical protein EAZ89_15160 [Bacteroidota bacterium]
MPDPPATLSELGVFTDFETLATAPGIIPYGVNAPLWSDRAAKNRWVALPNDGAFDADAEKVTFRDEDYWQFPAGTVFIKHFDLPLNEGSAEQRKKLETRFFVVTEDGGAYGVTYKWNDAGTEAYLLTGADTLTSTIVRGDGSTYRQTWDFPSREQCMTCHNANAGHVLGVRTRQLNGDLTYGSGITSNQLETWAHLGIFDKEIADPAQYPRSAPMTDANSSPEFRVRSYIDANCAFCHRPNGVEAAFDARALTALYDQNLIYEQTISHSSPVNSQVIVPGQPLNSVLYNRDLSTGIDAMPPIAKNMIDQGYVTVLNEWITELPIVLPAVVNSGWYNLEVRHSGKVASVAAASGDNGAAVVQETKTLDDYQKWNLQLVGGNKYRIMAGHSNQALTTLDWNPQKGTELVQQPWAGHQNQMWYLEDAGDGYYNVISAYSGMALDIFGAQTGEGAKVIAWEKTQGQNQQWKLLPAAP